MASFLRVSSCSITRSCSGPTRVVNTPLNRGGCAPNLILNPRSTVRKTHWDTFGRSFHAAKKITKGTSLLRLASGVLRTTSLVPSSGDPAGDGRSSCFKHFFGGSEPFRTATIPGRRLREKLAEVRCALNHRGWQGKRNNLLRALRRDGHHMLRCVPLLPKGACPQMSWADSVRTFWPKPFYWKWWSSDPSPP